MKYLLLLLISLNLSAATNGEELNNEVELVAFGLSYHTNRNYDFNEKNPGLGINVAFNRQELDQGYHVAMVVGAGTYKDSYRDQAKYVLFGPRLTLGFENEFHVELALPFGYLNGSGNNGAAIMPYASVGYDRFSLCFTGDLVGHGKDGQEGSKMVAAFLKVKLFDF